MRDVLGEMRDKRRAGRDVRWETCWERREMIDVLGETRDERRVGRDER